MEIGGFIELDKYSCPMPHEDAIALNCARNALCYLCAAKGIEKLAIPKFLCSSVSDACRRMGVAVRHYPIGIDFLPDLPEQDGLVSDEWIYVVNYYGQLDNTVIAKFKERYGRIIVDNVQSYFQMPVAGVDTIYTCRKFFGVPDGAFLYTDKHLGEELPIDESYGRMSYLLGRFERTASEFYDEYVQSERRFENEPIKRMSKLTNNLLHGIDYESVRERRTENFKALHGALERLNRLSLSMPEGAFMYPLYIEGGMEIREKLREKKIYIPTLWSDVFAVCGKDEIEHDMAENILPLPVDQRYGEQEMRYVVDSIWDAL